MNNLIAGVVGVDNSLIIAVLILIVSLVVAWIVQLLFHRVLAIIVGKTATTLDDQLLKILGGPIFWSVILGGVYLAALELTISANLELTLRNGLISAGLIVWWVAIVKVLQLLLRGVNRRVAGERKEDLEAAFPFLDSLVKIVVAVVLGLTALSVWGINITPALASAGVAGVAVAFAAKDTVANVFGGLSVFFDKPYRVGDYVVFKDKYRGEVTEIGIRSTKITTRDNVVLTVPNSVLVTDAVVNETGVHPHLRIRIPLGVAYGTNLSKVEKVLLTTMKQHKDILQKPKTPRVRFRSFGVDAIELEILGLIARPADRGRVIHDLIKAFDKTLAKESIEVPFPQRDVHLKKA